MYKISLLSILLTVTVLGVGRLTWADVITAEADTWVQLHASQADTNHGSETTMVAANDGGSFNVPKGDDSWSIMRFDISSFLDTAISASLRLQQTAGYAASFELYSVADGGTDEVFNESTYTFNTSAYGVTASGAGNDGGLNKNHVDLSLLGSFTTTAVPETVIFSDANLLSFANADSNGSLTLILYQSTQNKVDNFFATREAASGQPQLTLSAVPEPSVLTLLVFGGLALSGRRRLNPRLS
jgi:hypothetical protein